MKAGDTVQLKSGGPTMTIREIVDQTAVCNWFEGHKSHHGTYPLVSLKEVEMDDGDVSFRELNDID